MKQVLIRRGQATVDEVPAPLIEPGHVLVEVAYYTIGSGKDIESLDIVHSEANINNIADTLIMGWIEWASKLLSVEINKDIIISFPQKILLSVRGQLLQV